MNRFCLHIGETHHVEMSPSLSSILGFTQDDIQSAKKFNTKIKASLFPILDRGINNLYVYSNIVESVFVGNVKAPLMLTCLLVVKKRLIIKGSSSGISKPNLHF